MIKNAIFFFLVVFFGTSTRAQIDTSFWFAAPDISAQMGQSPVVLHLVTYDQASVVYIRQPVLTGTLPVSTSVSINASSVFTLNLSPYINSGALESAPVNSVTSKGLYISSKELISAYYTIGSGTNKEMVSLKGEVALGTDFYATIPNSAAALTHTVTDGGMGIDVVATEPGTTIVLFSPKAACVGRAKNITFAKFLTQGQTFSLLDTNTLLPSELAGTIISSDKLIAVTVKGSIRTNTTICPSYFTDQITPSNRLGTDYVVQRGNGYEDITFVVAPLNATSFTVSTATGSFQTLINASESYSISNTDPVTYIKASSPVYLFHLSGFGCKMSGAQLAPVYCAGTYSSNFVRLTSDSLYMNITVRNGNQGNFILTTNSSTLSLPSTAFLPVPGTASVLVSARVFMSTSVIPVGSYNSLVNTKDIFGLSIINGGTTGGSAYANASDFRSTAFVSANFAPTATICANSQFTLNGAIGGGPNTGFWSIINGYGTFSSALTNFTNNIYTPSILDTTNNNPLIPLNDRYVKLILKSTGICPSLSDTLRLQVKQPPIVSAGSNSVICGNRASLTLNGNVFGATNLGVWNALAPASGTFVFGTNSLSPQYLFSSADTSQTSLQFALTSTNNGVCAAETKTVTVFINKPPLVDAGVSSTVVCSNNATLSLNGTVSGTATSTGVWQTNGSGLFTPNNLSLNGNYLPSGIDLTASSVWLYLQSSNNGLCASVKDSIQVFITQPAQMNAGSDINTCSNDPVALLGGALTGTTVGQITWSGGGGSFSPSASVLTPTYVGTASEITSGFVTLTLSTISSAYCLGTSDIVKINFQPKPLANFTVGPVCFGQETQFSNKSLNLATTGIITNWVWNFGDGTPISTLVDPSHQYKLPGTYTTQLVVKNSYNCFDTIRKASPVNSLPTVSFSVARDCNGSAQKITFLDKTTTVDGDVINDTSYYYDFGGFGFSVAKDTSIEFPSDGIYTISHLVSTTSGCQSIFTKTIEVTARPVARFIYFSNTTAGFGSIINFRDTSSNAISYNWSFGNGITSEARYPTINYSENGNYPVILTVADIYSCTSTYSLEVKVANIVSEIIKLIPNVVSPNGDGKNDYWRLDFIDVYFPEADIQIFNRWGERIFLSKGYSNAWDGSYKGLPLPVGAYYYTIQLNDGVTEAIKGSITLLK